MSLRGRVTTEAISYLIDIRDCHVHCRELAMTKINYITVRLINRSYNVGPGSHPDIFSEISAARTE